MNTEEIIRELKHVEEQYKNRPTPTFEINISCMARDCRKHIEFLSEQIEKMKCNALCLVFRCGKCPYSKPSNENCRNCDKWELAE